MKGAGYAALGTALSNIGGSLLDYQVRQQRLAFEQDREENLRRLQELQLAERVRGNELQEDYNTARLEQQRESGSREQLKLDETMRQQGQVPDGKGGYVEDSALVAALQERELAAYREKKTVDASTAASSVNQSVSAEQQGINALFATMTAAQQRGDPEFAGLAPDQLQRMAMQEYFAARNVGRTQANALGITRLTIGGIDAALNQARDALASPTATPAQREQARLSIKRLEQDRVDALRDARPDANVIQTPVETRVDAESLLDQLRGVSPAGSR